MEGIYAGGRQEGREGRTVAGGRAVTRSVEAEDGKFAEGTVQTLKGGGAVAAQQGRAGGRCGSGGESKSMVPYGIVWPAKDRRRAHQR